MIGPNGAGKTTLFDVVSGFVSPDAGTVVFAGNTLAEIGPDARARLGIARSFQDVRLFPSLTVRQNIAVARQRHLSPENPVLAALWSPNVRDLERKVVERVDALVDVLGLHRVADRFVDELSTGQRRALDVACIMASEPSLLLLDEPSSGLAQAETVELGPIFVRVARETGCAIVIIEHDLSLVASMADRVVAMDLGRVLVSGSPALVLEDPAVAAAYLRASGEVGDGDDFDAMTRRALRPPAGRESFDHTMTAPIGADPNGGNNG